MPVRSFASSLLGTGRIGGKVAAAMWSPFYRMGCHREFVTFESKLTVSSSIGIKLSFDT